MNAQALSSTRSLDDVVVAMQGGSAARDAFTARFARAFLARVPEDELAGRSAAEWAALVQSFIAFAGQRVAGAPKIEVSNPEPGADGFDSTHTVVRIVNDDMPFLVDSVRMALSQREVAIHQIVHPVFAVTRDAAGALVEVGEGLPESMMHVEIDRQADADAMAAIAQAILASLTDVREAVVDWQPMRDRMLRIADELATRPLPVDDAGRREAQDFLRWAADNHFTFLGYREYEVVDRQLVPVQGSGLGLLRGKDHLVQPRPVTGLAAADLPPGVRLEPLILTKTNARATVHRPGYMDYIGVLVFDETGRAVREHRFLGLYTSSAYNRRPWDIPLVRQRHEHVMSSSGLAPDSHSGKALRHILESLPRDELFQSTAEELQATASGILGLQERSRTRLFLRRDRYGRFFSALVYIPRDRFNTTIRHRIEALLMRELQGERLDHAVRIGESPLAQLHLVIRPKAGAKVEVDLPRIEAELQQIVRDWHDELRETLLREHGEEQGLRLFQRYGRGLPAGYVEATTPPVAASDLLQASLLSGPDDLRITFYRDEGDQLGFKLIRRGGDIVLSDVLPVMENLGLRVVAEHPYALQSDEGDISIQDFEVMPLRGEIDVVAATKPFEHAFGAIWLGLAENDGFNRLLPSARLEWRDIAMLRGYAKYALQTGVPFSQPYMEEALQRNPVIARLLYELFAARFEPGREQPLDEAGQKALHDQIAWLLPKGERAALDTIPQEIAAARGLDRAAQVDAVTDAIEILLEQVSSIDDDRILRGFMALIGATLRTSFYQRHDGAPRDYISFKFDPSALPDLPKPRPFREIFVYSPYVEGTHLRFGPVARGGLRWSDRREDFRTEVLGLVKAQMVKNTVIVPVGSKGGFVVKRPPAAGDRDAVLAEGIACYKRFINGLLDITDNLVDGQVAPPRDVVRHDGDDPYLVVAADKGTASFSDIANGISAEHGYWLGDAFASGGSVGYDHKGMGITARGAWESVKRHFRALGIDSQNQDFTCVGVGDMSGDVFGNGMLLSKHIRLVAAFDHRHVFLDPNPDPARSWIERERLFNLPRSSWEDYDRSLISPGGGVHPRSAKAIPLTPEVRAALAIESDVESMSPNELMNAILKAPVDLLWNGGIGTYVKSSVESHADVGDRANNGLRVDGRELRCKAVGEGGNLGLTQRGRIEAASVGVLLNTDFIDNSAGVDTSDHEVNIKILLSAPLARDELSQEQRNALLASMTDEVGELVLTDNYRQNQAISLMEKMSFSRLGSFGHFIRTLEAQGLLDRAIEYLPSDAELAERKLRGVGLTRPELAVLLSYDKIVIFNQMLDSDVPEDPYLSKELVRYFPQALQDGYERDMQGHRLRREIIATAVTNSMVNRMGSTFVMRMQEDTGESPAQIAKAYTISREALDARELWAQIDNLDLKVAESAQLEALTGIWHLQREMTRWLLNRPGENLDIAAKVERYAEGIAAMRGAMADVLPAEARATLQADIERWQSRGFPDEMARSLASLPYLTYALDIVEVAMETGRDVADVATAWFSLSDALHTRWLMDVVGALPVEGRWHAQARGVLRDELQAQQRALVGQVLAHAAPGSSPQELVSQWLSRGDATLRGTLAMFSEMRNLRGMDYPTLSVAVRRLAQVVAAG